MTVEELFRRIVRAHLPVILACLLVPVVVVGVVDAQRPPSWTGVVRIQVKSAAPGSTTEADAMSSRVLALATTPSLIERALAKAHLRRDPAVISEHRVSAERLGSAPIVELQVVDRSQAGAGRLVVALAGQVASFMNDASTRHTTQVLDDLAAQVKKAEAKQSTLIDDLTDTLGRRPRATAMLRIQMAGRNLSQLLSQRNALRLAAAQRDPVVVIDGSHPSVTRLPSPLVAQTALAALLGLVLGLAVAVAIETLRPRLAGPRALARRLDAPVIASTDMSRAALGSAVDLAARRQGVETVVVMGVDAKDAAAAARLVGTRSPAAPLSLSEGIPSPRGAKPTGSRLDPDLDAGRGVRLTDLSSVGIADEHTAGVLVVSSGNARADRVEALEDVLKAMRWPVVGIVVAARKPRSTRS